jgi:hypothetical protein
MASFSISAPALCSRTPIIAQTNRASSRVITKPFAYQLRLNHQNFKSILIAASVGDDAVSSWLDLAGFVAKTKGSRSPYEELAFKIGDQCYIDVQGWHLYLKDVKIASGSSVTMADALAEKLGSNIQSFNQPMLDALLAKVPVKLGQGKATLSLADVMPSRGVQDLAEICEKYKRDN